MTDEERTKLIEGIKAALEEQNAKVVKAVEKHDTDLKELGKVQTDTKDQIAELNKKGQELWGRINEIEQEISTRGGKGGGDLREKSLGDRFAESAELKKYVDDGGRGKSQAMKIKTITSLPGSGASGIWSDRLQGVIEEPLRRLTIRDLIDTGRTSSNLIEWIRELLYTNNADVVSEGALKPESNLTYERADVPVRTIAHWIKATRQVLSDFPQLATLINGRLIYGLKIKEEDQILLGDGTGENILGLIPQATAYSGVYNKAGDTFIDIIRHAILEVRLSFYPASGIVLNPVDWHHIELTKDGENRYLMASPSGVLPPMLWGLPVVDSDAMPVDEFMVGAFRLAATLFDREDASIMVSTEDGDNFVRNMVTILCEERLALAVSRPRAFVHGSFPAGSTPT